ncbi:MAG: hypothetical protein PHU63_04315 [Candidatus ainarchaeum sp.]|nr:hypothetical protein [Candidatus ainarchaeum sp.]
MKHCPLFRTPITGTARHSNLIFRFSKFKTSVQSDFQSRLSAIYRRGHLNMGELARAKRKLEETRTFSERAFFSRKLTDFEEDHDRKRTVQLLTSGELCPLKEAQDDSDRLLFIARNSDILSRRVLGITPTIAMNRRMIDEFEINFNRLVSSIDNKLNEFIIRLDLIFDFTDMRLSVYVASTALLTALFGPRGFFTGILFSLASETAFKRFIKRAKKSIEQGIEEFLKTTSSQFQALFSNMEKYNFFRNFGEIAEHNSEGVDSYRNELNDLLE